jgi:hypothetical protein
MGYLFIIGLILILATFFGTTMRRNRKRIEKWLDREVEKARSFTWGKR